jgi:hypothetical protein
MKSQSPDGQCPGCEVLPAHPQALINALRGGIQRQGAGTACESGRLTQKPCRPVQSPETSQGGSRSAEPA